MTRNINGVPKLKYLRGVAANKQRNKCYYCKISFTQENPPTAEHLKPRSEGGKDSFSNIVAACASCNHGRHALSRRLKTIFRRRANRRYAPLRVREGRVPFDYWRTVLDQNFILKNH